MNRLPLAAALTLAVAVVACTPVESDGSTSTAPPATVAGSTTITVPPGDLGPVAPPVRHPITHESIYFVMPDRFANGSIGNDTGGIDGGPLDHGYLPEDTGFYHGGDLVGLRERLPYLANLGITALWITPPFRNRPVQGGGEISNSSAGYHGYWQIDWSAIDPHLGTEREMQALISAAKEAGIKVFFDIVVNHTGDVITYEEGSFSYRSKSSAPYLDADGNPFDPAELAGSSSFPDLDPVISFPYTPTFTSPEDALVKSPDWLNDVTLYHNRGNSTFVDENSLYGDFFGLDDLFTEHPRVVQGMIDLHSDVVSRYDIDGFRIDTVKHVNDEFWEAFAPALLEHAAGEGRPDFFMFGEVFASDPIYKSNFTTNLGLQSVLDFRVNDGLQQYVGQGLSADSLADAFDADDWYTDHDSNASMLVKFFGNHDIGRMGRLIDVANPGALPATLLAKMQLGFDLLFLTRGVPVVYYGDEQGFVGNGGDQEARQSMFPSVTPEYVDQETIGSDSTPGDDNFDESHPLYRWVAGLNQLRLEHPSLTTGAQYVHGPQNSIFSFSRIDRDARVEYLVVANNAALPVPATVRVMTPDTQFVQIWPVDGRIVAGADQDGVVRVEVPARSTMVFRADAPLSPPPADPSINLVRPNPETEIPTVRYRIEAELADRRYAEVTFAIAVDGGEAVVLGTDDAPPYRLYWNNAAIDAGASVKIMATVDDGSGRLQTDSVTVTMGER